MLGRNCPFRQRDKNRLHTHVVFPHDCAPIRLPYWQDGPMHHAPRTVATARFQSVNWSNEKDTGRPLMEPPLSTSAAAALPSALTSVNPELGDADPYEPPVLTMARVASDAKTGVLRDALASPPLPLAIVPCEIGWTALAPCSSTKDPSR